VFGQDTAVEKLLDAVYIARAGLKDLERPMGCYLFAGPTGTGKTEVAVQLSAGLGVPLLRYDMSEYMEPHKIATLIGSPPGYVGYADGGAGSGKLINDLEKSPNCVILFDEVEKAHPDILNVLLGLMDNGLVTSSNGKTVNARNATIIMTSNLGAAASEKKVIGFGSNRNDSAITDAVNKHFAPEFRNRLDAVVEFDRLKPEVLSSIADKFIRNLNRQLDTDDRHLRIKLSVTAQDALLAEGYSETMGARPMKRVINERIKKPLSRKVLFEGWNNGTVHVNYQDNEFNLNYEPAS
jgi:ATP-dependent Clp protease ATP-binding subunit ClpA